MRTKRQKNALRTKNPSSKKPPKGLHAELTGEEIVLPEAENGDFWTAYENEAKRRLKGMRVSVKGTIKEQKEREAEAKRRALEYAIYEKADILFPAGWNGNESNEAPWSLRDAMAAAEALSDTLFPQMQVEQETLRLAKGA